MADEGPREDTRTQEERNRDRQMVELRVQGRLGAGVLARAGTRQRLIDPQHLFDTCR